MKKKFNKKKIGAGILLALSALLVVFSVYIFANSSVFRKDKASAAELRTVSDNTVQIDEVVNLFNLADRTFKNLSFNSYYGIDNIIDKIDKTQQFTYSAFVDNSSNTYLSASTIAIFYKKNGIESFIRGNYITSGLTGRCSVTLPIDFDYTGVTAMYLGFSAFASGKNDTVIFTERMCTYGTELLPYTPYHDGKIIRPSKIQNFANSGLLKKIDLIPCTSSYCYDGDFTASMLNNLYTFSLGGAKASFRFESKSNTLYYLDIRYSSGVIYDQLGTKNNLCVAVGLSDIGNFFIDDELNNLYFKGSGPTLALNSSGGYFRTIPTDTGNYYKYLFVGGNQNRPFNGIFQFDLYEVDKELYDYILAPSYDSGYNDGEEFGYNWGFDDGKKEVQNSVETGKNLFFGILDAPINAIKNIFNFEIFGINISSAILFVVSCILVVFVIKKLI